MNPDELQIAKCCSTCLYTNDKPKLKPENHAAHYMVAKTERWCTLHQCPTVREGYCESYEEIENKGGGPAVKRARKQIARLNAIIAFKEKVRAAGGEIVDSSRHSTKYFRIVDGKVGYYYSDLLSFHPLDCKSSNYDDILQFKYKHAKPKRTKRA